MKIEKPTEHDSSYYLHFSENCFMHGINDWSQIFGKYNWYSFHFIHIYFEKETMTDGLEFEVAILGLGFRIRYNYSDKLKKMCEESELEKRLKDFENNTP